ncbi:MAG: DUF1190 domain-containing protein [Pseudomonas sp.]|uniref:DUF1190 domain-containing protein n=1 Tax=Pseudomonas abieticivorans TaxID=2931382 RepID=UPI0020BE0C6D|nr:DUF1190 domain-containing protein [Pseudomonas sp. PIA16]MDE1168351.1 DUF1190 domain-containing protein [Pseudomonas sp.]
MKRSKYVQLSLAASVAMAVAGCGAPEKSYSVKQQFNFQSVQQCVDQKFPVDVCSDAYISAMAEHRRLAPVYDNQADCDADFVANYCQQDSNGKFIPQLGGFQLAADGEVSQSQLDAAKAQAASSGGGSGGMNFNGILTGLLIGNMLSNNSGRYYSEPVYRYRDSRGDYASSTLGQRVNSGSTFSRSQQAQTSGSSYTSSLNKPVSVAGSTSRGGFGSKATARSGWGGSSRSSGSFGG